MEQQVSKHYQVRTAKKLYTNCTAAVLRAKECVMDTVATVQENVEDIYAEAQQINEERAAEAEEMGSLLNLMRRKKQKKFPKILSKKLQNRIRNVKIKAPAVFLQVFSNKKEFV